MISKYRKLYEKGEFKDLLVEAQQGKNDEARLWELIAYVNLPRIDLARKFINRYSKDFRQIKDLNLRQNFLNLAKHIRNSKMERSYSEFDETMFLLFSNLFNSIPKNSIVRRYKSSKSVDYTNYFCHYTEDPIQFDKIEREYNLLNAIYGNISVETPKPIEFAIDKSKNIAAYFYNKIHGRTLRNTIKPPIDQLLAIILELQELSNNIKVKSLLLEYRPEIETFQSKITEDMLKIYFPDIKEETYNKIFTFIELCKDYLQFNNKDRTFVHGDFWTGNIIYDQNDLKINGIIDFERCWYSDPWIDFSKLTYNDDHLAELLKKYNVQISSIDIDYITGKILLYRGLFILRSMIRKPEKYLFHKINSWIIKPVDNIKGLLH